jgi:hypothetical protein
MRIEFYTVYGDTPFHTTEKENITDFINFLKSTDEINVCIDKDTYYQGTVDKILYDIQFDEDGQPLEKLRVDVYDFREKLSDQENKKNKSVPNKSAKEMSQKELEEWL